MEIKEIKEKIRWLEENPNEYSRNLEIFLLKEKLKYLERRIDKE